MCTNTAYPYSISTVTGATSYTWTATAGSSIAGQGSKNVSITFGSGPATNQVITVTASNACGNSAVRSLNNITISNCPKLGDANSFMLSVYPNPAKNKVNVSFNGTYGMLYKINIVDMTGRLLLSNGATGIEGANQMEIDLSTVSTGVYFLEIQSENINQQVRLLVE